MDGISANDIGNFPDRPAESLQRVTGVQISVEGDEGQRRQGRIAIHGLLTNTQSRPTTGSSCTPRPDFDSASETSISVVFSKRAENNDERDAGGLAGTVDIQSKRALDAQEPYVRLGLQTTYETNLGRLCSRLLFGLWN